MSTDLKKISRVKKNSRNKPKFVERLIKISRVSKVTKGGKKLSFRAVVVIGDENGKFWLWPSGYLGNLRHCASGSLTGSSGCDGLVLGGFQVHRGDPEFFGSSREYANWICSGYPARRLWPYKPCMAEAVWRETVLDERCRRVVHHRHKKDIWP